MYAAVVQHVSAAQTSSAPHTHDWNAYLDAARHLYSAISGFLLIYYPFGNGCFHAFVPAFLSYLAMLRLRQHAAVLSWLITFGYLLYWWSSVVLLSCVLLSP